jgi:hypothetical protein
VGFDNPSRNGKPDSPLAQVAVFMLATAPDVSASCTTSLEKMYFGSLASGWDRSAG